MKDLGYYYTAKNPAPLRPDLQPKRETLDPPPPQPAPPPPVPNANVPEGIRRPEPLTIEQKILKEFTPPKRLDLYGQQPVQEKHEWKPIPDKPQYKNYEKKKMTLAEIYKAVNPAPDPYTIEQENKRMKARGIAAAIGDGISAIANLVGTANYAKPTQPPRLTPTYAARLDALRVQRKAEADRYNNMIIRLKEREIADEAAAAKEVKEDYRWGKDYELKAADAQRKIGDSAFQQKMGILNFGLKRQGQAFDQAHKTAVLGETKRANKVREAQGAQKIGLERAKHQYRVANGGYGGGGNQGGIVLFKNVSGAKKINGSEIAIRAKVWENPKALAHGIRTILSQTDIKNKSPYYYDKLNRLMNQSTPLYGTFSIDQQDRRTLDDMQGALQGIFQHVKDYKVLNTLETTLNSYN